MKQLGIFCFCIISTIILSGCADSRRELKTLAEITEHKIHRGEYIGDVSVYVINFMDETYEYKKFHPVYKQKDGSYTINYSGEDYVLSKLNDPINLPGCEYTKVKWKFYFDCFIEEIPN